MNMQLEGSYRGVHQDQEKSTKDKIKDNTSKDYVTSQLPQPLPSTYQDNFVNFRPIIHSIFRPSNI